MSEAGMNNRRRAWYVVHSKPRQESLALDNLARQGYLAYCPKATVAKRRRQRWIAVTEPLFPRYLFVQLTEGIDDFAPVRSTVGVADMVRFGGKPAVIAGSLVEIIRQQEHRIQAHARSHPDWKKGDLLEIIDGPFAGIKAVFEKTSGKERVMVLFELLGCRNRVAVDVNHVASALLS